MDLGQSFLWQMARSQGLTLCSALPSSPGVLASVQLQLLSAAGGTLHGKRAALGA